MAYSAEAINRAIQTWDDLRGGFLYTQDKLEALLDNEENWTALGYQSFFEAWDDKMSDITLAKELNLRVVARFLQEGIDVDRIALSMKGVGPETVRNVERELTNGVPPEQVRGTRISKPIYVRPHGRERAAPSAFIRFEVGRTMRGEYERIAAILGRPVSDIARDATEQHFAALAKGLSRAS